MKSSTAIGIGIAATLTATALWHGPGGAAERFATTAERTMRITLDHFEMNAVKARLVRGPLTRQLRFYGPADDFQRGEIARIGREVPGVSSTVWTDRPASRPVPLIAEVMAMALACFAIGAILAYIAALRRRARDAIYE